MIALAFLAGLALGGLLVAWVHDQRAANAELAMIRSWLAAQQPVEKRTPRCGLDRHANREADPVDRLQSYLLHATRPRTLPQ